jgi:polyphenol oxidase
MHHLPKPINEPQLIESKLFHSIGIKAFFTERRGGVSLTPYDTLNFGHDIGDDTNAVSTNIKRLIKSTGLSSKPHQARQVHGINHLICNRQGEMHRDEADILITSETNTPIAVRTADCLPILLADPVAKVVAAVHAGWRGTAQRVAVKAVELMQQQGATLDNIHAALGPCIGPCCFEIDNDTADQLATSAVNAAQAMTQKEKPHADLTAINIMQLQETGIAEGHMESNRLCTQCHPERFYSYRRDQGQTGRHLAVVALPDGN